MFTARRRSISSRVSVNTLPYLPNPNLYSWDFTARNLNGSTILRVPEMARGAANAWEQPVAASQPNAVATGASFPADLSRSMALASPVPLNGAAGVYYACNMQISATSAAWPQLLQILRNTPALGGAGRLTVDFRNYGGQPPETFIDQTDTTAYPIRQRPAMTIAKGIWYTIEQQHDFVTPANNRAWLNGVEVAANIITAFAATAYPLTDSAGAVTGNNFEGILNALGVYDGVPTPAVRQSFSGWINSVRPI